MFSIIIQLLVVILLESYRYIGLNKCSLRWSNTFLSKTKTVLDLVKVVSLILCLQSVVSAGHRVVDEVIW